MCLAIPARVINISKHTAIIESLGVEKEVDITLLPDLKKYDYVIVHAGFAIQVIDKEEALVTQGYWKEWLDEEGNQ